MYTADTPLHSTERLSVVHCRYLYTVYRAFCCTNIQFREQFAVHCRYYSTQYRRQSVVHHISPMLVPSPLNALSSPPERKRKASVEEICALETELSDLYSVRSGAKRRLLELVDGEEGSKDRAADIQKELQVCKEWESFCRGWIEKLDFPGDELELEREGVTTQLNNNAASLEAGLQEAEKREQEREALHCSRCRGDFTTTWNLDHHRWVTELVYCRSPDFQIPTSPTNRIWISTMFGSSVVSCIAGLKAILLRLLKMLKLPKLKCHQT